MIFPIRIVSTCSPQLFCHSSCNKQFLVFGIFFRQVGIHAFDWTCSICSYHLMFSIHRLKKVDLGRRRGKEICKLPIFKPIDKTVCTKIQIDWFLANIGKIVGYFLKIEFVWCVKGIKLEAWQYKTRRGRSILQL